VFRGNEVGLGRLPGSMNGKLSVISFSKDGSFLCEQAAFFACDLNISI
jgi:hypothetical protein